MKEAGLPHTDSIRELADFWDKHDLTDFEEELEEVKEKVFDHGMFVNVHFEANEFERIEENARKKGVSDSELVHEWIREKLRAA